jgi:hypothetical protein
MGWARIGRRRRRYRCPYLVVPGLSTYFVDLYAPSIEDPDRTRAELEVLLQVAVRVHQAMGGGCKPVVNQQGQLVCPYEGLVSGIMTYAFMPSARVRLEVYGERVDGGAAVPDGTPAHAYL